MSEHLSNEKRGQSPFERSTHRAVPTNGDCPLSSSSSSPIPTDFWPLLDAACANELTDDQMAELQTHLESNSAARQAYIAHIRLRTGIRQWWKGERARASGLSRIEAEFDHSAPPADVLSFDENPSAGETFEQPHDSFSSPFPLSTSHYPPTANFVGGPVFSYMVATVVLCVMLLSAWAYKITHDQGEFVVKPKSPSSAVNPEYVSVGQVTDMRDCSWMDDNSSTIIGASVSLGRKYSFTAGLMEITYRSGAVVILEGPCVYEVNSKAGGRLQLGKLVARVEKNDELGMMNDESHVSDSDIHHSSFISHNLFSVTTPTAVVTDLGTEFGVEVAENGETTSHVFRGSVKMQAIGDDQHVELRRNESAKVKNDESGRPLIKVLGTMYEPCFVLEMPASKSAAAASAYAELVLSLDPVAYFRMERPKDKTSLVVRDSTEGKHHGELRLGDVFGGSPYREGRRGEALWFRGPDAKDSVIVPDYPKATDDRLTISAWVLAVSRPAWAMIASNWGNLWRPGDKAPGQFHFGLYRAAGDLSARVTQRDGARMDIREGGDRPLPLNVWQHVAMVSDGVSLRLYRNGEEVAYTPCNGILANPTIDSLGIGCSLNETGSAARDDAQPSSIFWRGRIDELAIFNQALSDEQINLLFTGKQIAKETDDAEEGGIK